MALPNALRPLALGIALAISLSACNDSSSTGITNNTTPVPAPVPNTATATGFTLSVFANAPDASSKPDSIIQFGSSIYIGYQHAGDVKDGSVPGLTNTVVQYDLKGNALKTFTVPGHVDGLMARADTNALWVMSNEDANPILTIINLSSGAQQSYTPTAPTAHGGGFDDMQLINGVVYVSASNPTTPGAAAPTVVTLTLNANGTTFDVSPVLAGNAMATDTTPSIGGSTNPTYGQQVALSLSDPDSLGIDPLGELVLDSQADSKLIFIGNPGASNQTVKVLSLTLYNDKDGPSVPVDDTRWVPTPGTNGNTFMLFTDAHNVTYRVDGPFKQGDAYSAGQGQVMQLDVTSGHLTPFVVGIGNASALQDPHGVLFVTP